MITTCPMPQCQTTAGCKCEKGYPQFSDPFRAGQADILRRLREPSKGIRISASVEECDCLACRDGSVPRLARIADAIAREIESE